MIQIDMEKPNHCLHCPMCNGDDDCVLIQEIDTSWDWEEQYANCPLQEVEPERKKGKWIERDDCCDGIYYECSVCKYSFSSMEGTPSDNDYDFCPSCGSYNGG